MWCTDDDREIINRTVASHKASATAWLRIQYLLPVLKQSSHVLYLHHFHFNLKKVHFNLKKVHFNLKKVKVKVKVKFNLKKIKFNLKKVKFNFKKGQV